MLIFLAPRHVIFNMRINVFTITINNYILNISFYSENKIGLGLYTEIVD